jgi:hypothetical protein
MGGFDPDICVAVGVILLVLSVPSVISAIIDKRAPRVAAITMVIAGSLIVYAVQTNPGVYSLKEVPNVFIRIAAMII